MQTFLPYPDITKSVLCLDYVLLGEQRVDARKIYDTITGKSDNWKLHPAVRMWTGYEDCLAVYHNLCISRFVLQGFTNFMPYIILQKANIASPPWLGLSEFHASHRSNLLRKDLIYYSKFNWKEADNLPYIWPV